MKDTVFDFISPQQLVTFEILDAVVGRDELPNTGLSDVTQVLLGLVPSFGGAYFEKP